RRAPFHSSGENVAIADPGSLLIFAGGTRSDPAIYSATTSTMIIASNSLAGAGRPINMLDVLLHTMAISELSHVSTRACGPRNFMKITQSRRQNGRGFGAARLISQWRS